MAKRIEKVSFTLDKLLSKRGLGGRLKEYRVFGQWEKIVGKVIARHARPQSVRGKRLSVIVDSNAWMQQLSMLKPDIIQKVNRSMGKDAIAGITLKLGEVAVSETPSRERRVPVRLSNEEKIKVEEYVKNVQDDEAREVIKRVIEKDMMIRKKKT